MSEVNIITTLNEMIKLVENQAKLKKITVCFQSDISESMVKGNPSLLQQVFLNLFLNAINAMPDGGTITGLVTNIEDEVIIGISDTGHGIPKDELENIFDPFFTLAPVGKGTGLGLSICYSILKQHSGSLTVDSTVGQGSTFTVRLPIIKGISNE
jgi:signal transduction histidine kinase